MRAWALGLLLLGACTPGANVGRNATSSALDVLHERVQPEDQGKPATQVIGQNTMRGALSELAQPEERTRLGLLVDEGTRHAFDAMTTPEPGFSGSQLAPPRATPVEIFGEQLASAFAASVGRQLVVELGPSGEGPLTSSLVASTERVSASAAHGVNVEVATLFPECQGSGRQACIEDRLSGVSAQFGAAFAGGAMGRIRVPLLLLAFAAGFAAALAMVLVAASWRASIRRA